MTKIYYLDYVPLEGGSGNDYKVVLKKGRPLQDDRPDRVRVIAHRVRRKGSFKFLKFLWKNDLNPATSIDNEATTPRTSIVATSNFDASSDDDHSSAWSTCSDNSAANSNDDGLVCSSFDKKRMVEAWLQDSDNRRQARTWLEEV
jgi:hypothetical protein